MSSLAGTVQATKAPLPTNLPSMILPDGKLPNKPEGYSEVTILLDQALNWRFVATHSYSSAQIFVVMTNILRAGLGLSG
jgi:hypothetical protein